MYTLWRRQSAKFHSYISSVLLFVYRRPCVRGITTFWPRPPSCHPIQELLLLLLRMLLIVPWLSWPGWVWLGGWHRQEEEGKGRASACCSVVYYWLTDCVDWGRCCEIRSHVFEWPGRFGSSWHNMFPRHRHCHLQHPHNCHSTELQRQVHLCSYARGPEQENIYNYSSCMQI